MVYGQLGKRIREKRIKKKLTQEELAFRSGTDEKHYGKLERGQSLPNSFTLAKIIVSLEHENVLEELIDDFEQKFFEDVKYKG